MGQAWWSPAEGIRVTCGADNPEYSSIHIRGNIVQVENDKQLQSYSARMLQTESSKVWETPQFDLFVALRQSSWGASYHMGSLIEKTGAVRDIPLWCFPEIQD